jgi:lantibiotic modifying enzyme
MSKQEYDIQKLKPRGSDPNGQTRHFLLLLSLFLCLHTNSQSPIHYLREAINAEKWIQSLQQQDNTGICWPNSKDSAYHSPDLYSGNSGIVLFYLSLYQSTHRNEYLSIAQKAADRMINELPERWNEENMGLYTGAAGIAYTIHQVFIATKNKKYLHKTSELLKRISIAIAPDSVKEKLANDIVYGLAGIGLVYIYAHQHKIHPIALPTANSIAEILLSRAQPVQQGIRWPMFMRDTAKKFYMPNFSHGTAGIAYFLANLFEATKDKRYKDAALAAGNYLITIADKDGWIYHAEPNPSSMKRYYVSWCHGPAGTARLYYKLFQLSADKKWEKEMLKSADALMRCGLPTTKMDGYWNNISYCCGNAGIASFFLSLDELYPGRSYRQFADTMIEDLLKRSTRNNNHQYWIQAENRAQPQLLQAQTGLMQGASGVGITLLHALSSSRNKKAMVVLPDNPFIK